VPERGLRLPDPAVAAPRAGGPLSPLAVGCPRGVLAFDRRCADPAAGPANHAISLPGPCLVGRGPRGPLPESAGLFRWAVIGCTSLVWILNVFFLTSAGWCDREFLLNPFNPQEAENYETVWAPEHRLARGSKPRSPCHGSPRLTSTRRHARSPTSAGACTRTIGGAGTRHSSGFCPPMKMRFEVRAMTMPSTGSSVITPESGQDDPNAPAQRFFRLYTTGRPGLRSRAPGAPAPGTRVPDFGGAPRQTPTFSRAWRIGASVDRSS